MQSVLKSDSLHDSEHCAMTLDEMPRHQSMVYVGGDFQEHKIYWNVNGSLGVTTIGIACPIK